MVSLTTTFRTSAEAEEARTRIMAKRRLVDRDVFIAPTFGAEISEPEARGLKPGQSLAYRSTEALRHPKSGSNSDSVQQVANLRIYLTPFPCVDGVPVPKGIGNRLASAGAWSCPDMPRPGLDFALSKVAMVWVLP